MPGCQRPEQADDRQITGYDDFLNVGAVAELEIIAGQQRFEAIADRIFAPILGVRNHRNQIGREQIAYAADITRVERVGPVL